MRQYGTPEAARSPPEFHPWLRDADAKPAFVLPELRFLISRMAEA